jgi:hypothetical protein
MVGATHHLPGVTIVVDVPSPRQRFEGHAKAPLRRALTEVMKICRCAVDAAERIRGDVAADHQEITAEFFHQVEFAFGTGKCLCLLRLRHPLEIAKRLECHHFKAEILDPTADLRRSAIERQQVVLENLHSLEAGRSNSFELFVEGAAQANGSDGGLQ